MQATLSQEGRVRCVMVGTFGRLREDGFTHDASNTCGPQLPSPYQCLDATSILVKHMGDKLRIASRVQFFVPKTRPFLKVGSPGSEPYLQGWLRFSDRRPHDLSSSLFFLDCLPPPVLNIVPALWLPTLEYTVHFWSDFRDSDQSLLRVRFSSGHIENSTFHTDGELWSEDGTKLLAKSRQLARIIL
jgi:acyl-CoA thioesterase